MLICRLKQSIALTRKNISKWPHYAIRNVRRAIRTEMANKRGSVNWYQPDFHMSEKSQRNRNFYCFPMKKYIRQFRPNHFNLQLGKERRVEQLENWYQVTIFEWLWKIPNVNVIFWCLEWSPSHQSGARLANKIHLFFRFILDQLYPTHVRGVTCYLTVSLSGHISSA